MPIPTLDLPPGLRRLARPALTGLAALGLVAAPALAQRNVLVIVADDLGIAELSSYGVGSDLPSTPNLEFLASAGVRFTNAWSSPLCSPSRAEIQTGRLAHRTGLGNVIQPGEVGLPVSEVTIPEMLDLGTGGFYSHAAIGKWHLGEGNESALGNGYAYYVGVNGSTAAFGDYYDWTADVNGTPVSGTEYLTTQEVNDALDFISTATSPWFVHLGFHTPHAPLHPPPPHLHSVTLPGGAPTTLEEKRQYLRAMIEAMDTEIGNLLAGLPDIANTTIIFIGDNGTNGNHQAPPYQPFQGKSSLFEGGVRVPLIVFDKEAVAGGVCDALVQTVDIFATVANIANVDLAATLPGVEIDGISLIPYLKDPLLPSAREVMRTERFAPNGFGPKTLELAAVRDHRYKLMQHGTETLFFDLRFDPFEERNLLQPRFSMSPKATLAYELLLKRLHEDGAELLFDPQLPGDYAP